MEVVEDLKAEVESQGLDNDFEESILEVLESEKEKIEGMIYRFNSGQKSEELFEKRRKFPTFNDIGADIRKFDDYKNLELIILIGLYLEKEMDRYYKEVEDDVEALLNYLDGNKTERAERIYKELVEGRTFEKTDEEVRKELRKYLNDYKKEFENYGDETEAYEGRSINEEGLLLSDAVKCLEDFEGRTFPFLRGISAEVDEGDRVLEPGAGTGILMIASALSGAREVVGLEINPLTCILAKNIFDDLAEKGLFKRFERDNIKILWTDVLNFGTEEHRRFYGETFDTLISENIYTGMFYELQMEMIKHIIRTGFVEREEDIVKGVKKLKTSASVIPSAMSSGLQLAEVSGEQKEPVEVRLDFEERGGEVNTLSKDHIYDQMDFSAIEEPDILSVMRFHVTESGTLNALINYSAIRINQLDYIGRNENDFLNNDSIFFLNEPIEVEEGDQILVGLAFNQSVSAKDSIIEVRKVRDDGEPESYDARLDVSERKHKINKAEFKSRNNVNQELDLKTLGDFEVLKSSSFHEGYERPWMTDIDYKHIEGYGV